MGFQCGIVGLPNVGKSSLFRALTGSQVAAENYPFCTIDPNVGIVEVPDDRVNQIAALVEPERVIHATTKFVDIAGLVKGAAQGEGLGNQFLSHIRETQAIAHVVRCYDDPDVQHVHGSVDPVRDIEIIDLELVMADMDVCAKHRQKWAKQTKAGDKQAAFNESVLAEAEEFLGNKGPIRLADDELKQRLSQVEGVMLITSKPVIYVANVAEDDLLGNDYVDQLKAHLQGQAVMCLCAKLESELSELSHSEKQLFFQELGLEESGLSQLIQAGYRLLNLQSYFTAGPQEVRAWTIQSGMNAVEAAGKIHTDFMKHFIRAEVIGYDDFIAKSGEAGAKESGLWRLEGKQYIVQDGDVIFFRVSK
ncbi:MAG: redox-regulated ATPase YchF [Legionellales bacterium]|nr:redox-regulated ATPase YchF [Legionellales bacterium]|tara:strand:- start:674 stop:1762 length:1089 start_codon:yes stop_codon:yes gene_type:complete